MMKARLAAAGAAAALVLAGHGQAAVVAPRHALLPPQPVGLIFASPGEGSSHAAVPSGYQLVPGASWSGPPGLSTFPGKAADVPAPHATADASAIGSETAAMLLLPPRPDAPDQGDVSFHEYLLSAGEYVLAVGTLSGQASASTKISAVPLPGAIWLFGSGLLAFLGISSRHRL